MFQVSLSDPILFLCTHRGLGHSLIFLGLNLMWYPISLSCSYVLCSPVHLSLQPYILLFQWLFCSAMLYQDIFFTSGSYRGIPVVDVLPLHENRAYYWLYCSWPSMSSAREKQKCCWNSSHLWNFQQTVGQLLFFF